MGPKRREGKASVDLEMRAEIRTMFDAQDAGGSSPLRPTPADPGPRRRAAALTARSDRWLGVGAELLPVPASRHPRSARGPRTVTSPAARARRSASPAANEPSSRSSTTGMRREGCLRSGGIRGSSVVVGARLGLLRSWRSCGGCPGWEAEPDDGRTARSRHAIDSFGVRGRGRPLGDLAGQESSP